MGRSPRRGTKAAGSSQVGCNERTGGAICRHGLASLSQGGVGAFSETRRPGRHRQILRFPHNIFSLPQIMNISVFGLGYVGAVTAGGLTPPGHYGVGGGGVPPKGEKFK